MTKHLCSLFSSSNENSKVTDCGFLLLRLFIGLSMAFSHGLGKLPPPEMLIQGVQGLGFPMPEFFAWSAGIAEFAGGILIALGLLTRPAAAFMAFTMLVAIVGVHSADPFQVKEMAFLYLTLGIFFILVGAGRWSLDYVISRRCTR